MQKEILISNAIYTDLEEILALQKLAFLTEAEFYNNYEIEPLKQTLENITADFKDHIFLKADLNNKIIGSVKGRLVDGDCWIGKLVVNPEFRNKGLGRRLMLEIEARFPDAKQFLLYTGNQSYANIHLYESLGYKKLELFKDEKTPDIHLVKMMKENNR
jgi:ribosomal protein S18 acetylase RimI-like enzyme